MSDPAPSIFHQVWSELPRISVMIACAGVIWAVLTWATGGVRPQSSIDIDNIKAAIADLQRVQIADLQKNQAQILGRLDAMWRTQDYAERDGHFARLDSVFEALRDRV